MARAQQKRPRTRAGVHGPLFDLTRRGATAAPLVRHARSEEAQGVLSPPQRLTPRRPLARVEPGSGLLGHWITSLRRVGHRAPHRCHRRSCGRGLPRSWVGGPGFATARQRCAARCRRMAPGPILGRLLLDPRAGALRRTRSERPGLYPHARRPDSTRSWCRLARETGAHVVTGADRPVRGGQPDGGGVRVSPRFGVRRQRPRDSSWRACLSGLPVLASQARSGCAGTGGATCAGGSRAGARLPDWRSWAATRRRGQWTPPRKLQSSGDHGGRRAGLQGGEDGARRHGGERPGDHGGRRKSWCPPGSAVETHGFGFMGGFEGVDQAGVDTRTRRLRGW